VKALPRAAAAVIATASVADPDKGLLLTTNNFCHQMAEQVLSALSTMQHHFNFLPASPHIFFKPFLH
jgi:hypothetical protein